MRNQIRRVLRKLPFTLTLLGVLIVVGILTNTHTDRLSAQWLEWLGFAPNDLLIWKVERLFTSALVTYGGYVFWQALVLVALFVGLAEWMTSTRRALLTFWGVHLVVLISQSVLIAWPLRLWGGPEAQASIMVRDVGPSSGFFGCLGLVSERLPGKWRWISGGLIWSALIATAFLAPQPGESAVVKLWADLAHIIAFTLGWLSGIIREVKS